MTNSHFSVAQGNCGISLACWSVGPGLLFLCGCRILWKWLWFNGSADHSWPLNSRCPTGKKLGICVWASIPTSQSQDSSLLENTQSGTTQLQSMVLCWVGFEKQEGLPTSFWEPCTLCLVRPHQVSLHSSPQVCETDGSEQRDPTACHLPRKQALLAILDPTEKLHVISYWDS